MVAVIGLLLACLAGSGSMPAGASGTELTQSCVAGPLDETGSAIVSHPIALAIDGDVLAVPLVVDAAVTGEVAPGGAVTSVVTVTVDLAAQAREILESQVHPAIAAAGYPQLVDTSWVVLTLGSSRLRWSLPAGMVPTGTPTATSPAVGAAASFEDGDLVLDLGTLVADTRLAASHPISVTFGWTAVDGGAPAPRTLDLGAPSMAFDAWVDVGVRFAGSPIVGGAHGTWSCTAPPATLASTAVVDDPEAAPGPVLPQQGPRPVVTPPTSVPPQDWPERAVAPTGCEVAGFDEYGGWTGRSLDATGAFRTERIDGTWWLVDPLGHPFFSQGVNHVTFEGTPDRFGAAPYRDAVAARYGTEEAWADAQVRRFDEWGYNTAGAWSDASVQNRMPYVLLVGFTGQSSGTGQMEDLWEPSWAQGAAATAAAAAAAHGDDPNLVGYWTDNELHWGPDWRPLHLFDDYLARPASSPGKAHLVAWLQDRYGSFASFAADVATDAGSWAELADPTVATTWTSTGGEATRAAWVGEVAERYFSVTVGSLRAADPVHLQFGPRMIAQVTGTPVLEVAKRWVDVASFNLYPIDPQLLPGLADADPTYLPTDGALAAQAAVVDRPILISEWGFRAADSGLPNTWPPLFPTLADQDERAGASQAFVDSLLDTDWIVGQHIFEHADEPPAGRFDGEDSNFGLVDNADDPYPEMVQMSRWVHDCAYARLVPEATTTTTTPAVPTIPTTIATVAPSDGQGGPTPVAVPAVAVAGLPTFTG